MKIKALLIAALAVCVAHADEKLLPSDGTPKTYTLDEFAREIAPSPVEGQLVCIKFNYRATEISTADSGLRIGYLNAHLHVLLSAEALPWFQHLPTSVPDAMNAKTFLVYGRVKVGTDGGVRLKVLGNEIKHDDFKGDSIVWH